MRLRSFQSILDECATAVQRGETVEACLGRYPRHAARLKPLLTLAQKVRSTPAVQPRPWAQTTAWDAVRLRAADLRSGKRRRAASYELSFGWLKPVAVAFAFLMAVGVTGGATAFAAQDAAPNETLYPVKIFTEDVHVWITFDETSKADLLLDQSDERMDEISALLSDGESIPENVLANLQNRNSRAFGILEDRPEETALWSRAMSQAESQERILIDLWDVVEPDARVEYTEVVADVHNLQLPGSEAAVIELRPEDLSGGIQVISGTVELAEDGTWSVGGYPIEVDERSSGSQGIAAGSTVRLKVARGLGKRLYALTASLIESGAPPTRAVVSGEVEEVTDEAVRMNGQWYRITSDSIVKTRLRVGQTVSLTVDKADGDPQVASAEAVAGSPDSFSLTFEGVIQSDPSNESDEWTIGGLTFKETPGTQLDFTGGGAAEGARAVVEAVNTGDQLLAQKITVLKRDTPAEEVYLVGTFEGSRNATWFVSGLSLDPKSNGQAPEPGSIVAIEAKDDDGVFTVGDFTVIKTPDAPPLSRFIGPVTGIDNTTWTTPTAQFRVASRTTTVSGEELEGARAIIWYRPDIGGDLEAVYVHVLDEEPVVQPAEPPAEGD